MALKIKKSGDGHKHPDIEKITQVITKEPSKRLNADLPKSFYVQVKNFATEKDMSITDLVKVALKQYIENN
jgi:DNA replication initiation complex subunit (GINS family)